MTNQYMNNLYRDLLSNSPQTITIDIPADMGTGQISQIVTKQGAVVSDWRMNYFSDMNVQGVSSEEYIQMRKKWRLDTCTEAQRRRFLLYALDGLSYAEIGTVCG